MPTFRAIRMIGTLCERNCIQSRRIPRLRASATARSSSALPKPLSTMGREHGQAELRQIPFERSVGDADERARILEADRGLVDAEHGIAREVDAVDILGHELRRRRDREPRIAIPHRQREEVRSDDRAGACVQAVDGERHG